MSGNESLGTTSLGTAEMADMDIIDSIEKDMDIIDSIEKEAQVSDAKKLPYIVTFRANHPQMDVTKKTDTDIKCVAVSTCLSNSGDHRKIVSHVFGRNKACTRELPRNLWIFWCRKHYQRFKYRAENNGNWHYMQLRLVGQQLQIFQDWGHVRSWTVSLRKSKQATLAKEDESSIMHNNNVSTCWERCLVPFLGPKKTFADVRQILAAIERKFDEAEWCRYNMKLKSFPGVEFLPILHAHQKVSRARKPAAKKGQSLYKKITLDQPAFNRKTRANLQYIKEKAQFIKERAAKKTQALNTPKGSRAAFQKDKPLRSLLPKPPPTKRRRLMRGYEMHRSFDDEADTLIKTEDDEGRYEAW